MGCSNSTQGQISVTQQTAHGCESAPWFSYMEICCRCQNILISPLSPPLFRSLIWWSLLVSFQPEVFYDSMISWLILLNHLGDLDFHLCHLRFSGALLIPFNLPAPPYVTTICETGEITAVKVKAGKGSKLHKSFEHRERRIIWGHLQPPPILLVATIHKGEAGSSEWNVLWITFPLFPSPWSVLVVMAHGTREHNFSTICALQHCGRLVLGRDTLPLKRAELNEGGDARSEQRAGVFDPVLRHFQLRDMLL